eukprot:TCALIF_05074-PA protein Name:"Similar to Aldh5a1 Succinate-semialdehyde dehydrogenase, mitochondrial (Rattus norvegicus)" AED:0.17 eAED:0.17 QI:569/0.8/0.83/1/1/1/6/157/600
MHDCGLSLCRDFLRYKREHGSPAERDLYVGHDLDELFLVDRLLSKRPLSYVDPDDHYTLRNGLKIAKDWTRVGTDSSPKHLSMQEHMTYDEIQLSAALIQVSSPACPIYKTIIQIRTMSSLVKNKAFINGAWVEATSGKTFEVTNPVNGKVIGSVPDMDTIDANKAIDAAHEAFQTWRDTTAKERSALLRKWFEMCNKNHNELAKILTAEQGKPLAEAKGEVSYGSSFLEWFSEEARRINGDVVQAPAANKRMLFVREPIGVAAMITPWNFPNAMITRKVGAALASGCTVVVKPAEDTPLSALAVAALAEEAGIPKGVLNVITSRLENSSEVGKALCSSSKVRALSFTGSTRVGKILYRQCADTVKKISLELGGNAPFIVFDSADVDLAVGGCMASKFRNAGQTCVSSNRILVQSGIYDKFVAKLKETVEKSVVLGDGMDDGVNQGPIINKNQFARVTRLVDEAVNKGAKVVLGGSKHDIGDLFYKPTIISEMQEDMECFKEEVFGPVISIKKFETEDEALKIANNSEVGLAGYFYSNDVSQCWRVSRKLETGMVGINEGMMSCAEGAFGGVKESGIGREGSKYGIDEYTEMKYLCFGNL